MKSLITKHRRILGVVGGVAALGVAVVYAIVVPSEASSAGFFWKIVLLYGHSLCWLLLGAAGFVWAMNGPRRAVAGLAYAALAVYAVFIIGVI